MPEPDADDSRWDEALAAVEVGLSLERQGRLRRQRSVLRLVCLALLLVLLVPVALGLGDGDRTARPDIPDVQRAWGLGLIFTALVLIMLGTGFMLWQFRGRWTSPLTVLTRRQSQHLVAMVRGTVPTRPELVPLARLMAETMMLTRAGVFFSSGVVVMWTALTVRQPSVWRFVVLALTVVLMAAGLWRVRRDERDARRFLAEHPGDG